MMRPLVCLALLVAGCDETPACADPSAPRRMVDAATSATHLVTAWAGDHAYYVLDEPSTPASLFVGPRCGDARLVARGARLMPARIDLEPANDDPALACSEYGRFYRLDLTGEQLPALMYPDVSCRSVPTEHGLLVRHPLGGGPGLWLYPAFPDAAGATQIDEYGLVVRVRGDAVYFYDTVYSVARLDLATGERSTLADDVDDWIATETHLLWRENADGDQPARVLLTDVSTGTQHALGSPTSEPTALGVTWRFDANDEYVVHGPGDDAGIEAFDLRGEPVPLPAPGVLLDVLPGAAVLSRDADGQLFFTRLRASAPVTLDHRIDPAPTDTSPQFYRSPVADDRIEVLRGDELWAVPLGGAAASLLARDVDVGFAWIDEDHLLTLFDGVLQTISVPDGERRVHARRVRAFTTAGELSVDGAHYLREDGVWYLPPSALVPAE